MKPNSANPSALFLSIAMLLEHHGFVEPAHSVRLAVTEVINQPCYQSYDLGGKASTQTIAEAIIQSTQQKLNAI